MTHVGTCQMAGTRCYRTDTVLVRIEGVGDRRICETDLATLERMGVAFRRLDADAVVPEWRTRALARVMDHGPVIS